MLIVKILDLFFGFLEGFINSQKMLSSFDHYLRVQIHFLFFCSFGSFMLGWPNTDVKCWIILPMLHIKLFSQNNEAFRRWVGNFTLLHFLPCKMQPYRWLCRHSCYLCFLCSLSFSDNSWCLLDYFSWLWCNQARNVRKILH